MRRLRILDYNRLSHSAIIHGLEMDLFKDDLTTVKELISLGYRFTWDYISKKSNCNRICELQNLELRSLQSICVGIIRLILFPNAWVSARKLDIPKSLYIRYFSKYAE